MLCQNVLNVKKVGTIQSSRGSKTFSLVKDSEGNLYEIGYVEGLLNIGNEEMDLESPTLFVAKSRFEEDKRIFDFISLFPELVMAESMGSYDISIEEEGRQIYVIGPFLGDREEQIAIDEPEAFFIHLNVSGEMVQYFFILGVQWFLPMGLSGPYIFGNIKGNFAIRTENEDQLSASIPLGGEEDVSGTISTPKAFVAKYSDQDIQWSKIIKVRDDTHILSLLEVTTIKTSNSQRNQLYIGGSFRGALIYNEKCIAKNKCFSNGFLLKIDGFKGNLLWTRTQNIGYGSINSTYLSLSVGGKRNSTLFAVSLICKSFNPLILIEKIGTHGASEKKVKFDDPKAGDFVRIYADTRRVYILTSSTLSIYDLYLKLQSVTKIKGLVDKNYVKPMTSKRKHLYLGLGAAQNFLLGTFILSRISPNIDSQNMSTSRTEELCSTENIVPMSMVMDIHSS